MLTSGYDTKELIRYQRVDNLQQTQQTDNMERDSRFVVVNEWIT